MIRTIKEKFTFLLAILFATIVGSVSTAVVMAAIPGSGGVISGCYDSGGNLRVIDAENSETCTMSETALNWSANPEEVAFFGTNSNGTLDTTYSKNITDFSIEEDAHFLEGSEAGSTLCIEVPFTPRFARAVSKNPNYTDQDAYRTNQGSSVSTLINTVCGPGYNVMLPVPDGWGMPRDDLQLMIH